VLFVGERYLDLVAKLRPDLTGVKHFACYDKPVDGMGHLGEILATASADEPFVEVDESRPTVLIYTSGTTSQPKGVALSYLNLSVYVTNTMSPADPGEDAEVTLLSVPIFHVAGVTPIMSSVWGGRTLVILPQFDPELWLKAVQSERVTHSFVVPTMLKRIMDHPDFHTYDLSSLKLITYGAAPMPYEVVSKAVDAFSCGLMNAYGQTESTSTMTFLGPDDHQIPKEPGPEREKKLHRLRSVGRGMDDVVIAIMDEKNEILEPGAEGEICVMGPRIMSEYHKQAEATAAAIHDGWLHTGERGLPGRGRLPLHHRPQEGPDHPRWREHLVRRDRSDARRAPADRRVGGDRCAGRGVGRGDQGHRRAGEGARARPGGGDRVRQGAPGELQGAGVLRLR
jgi:Acyl-CoA synthetases (AMP-forming)/AMP-acid ligases II